MHRAGSLRTSTFSPSRPAALAWPLVLAAVSLLTACGGPTQGMRPNPATSSQAAQRNAASPSPAPRADGSLDPDVQAIAAWRDHTVTWGSIRPAMIELAGATALRDAFLDQRLAQALAEKSITIGASETARERQALTSSLDPDPNMAERLLQQICARQGLGPIRFDALLRRNAGLRALVQGEVRLTPDAIERQHEAMHGVKRVCRVIAVPSIALAEELRRQLDAGANFAELATKNSSDASGSRGGLLAPISRVDPTWPEAFRQALFALSPGATSPPTLVDRDYLLIRFEEEKPADGLTLATTRAEVEAALRAAQERVLMEEKAQAFLGEIEPSFYDTAFGNAWRRVR